VIARRSWKLRGLSDGNWGVPLPSISNAASGTQAREDRPCIGTSGRDVLYERPGNGTPDTIYGRRGDDVLKADEHRRDKDRLFGERGGDRLNVRDHDFRNHVKGGRGFDLCIADYSEEIGRGCERVRVTFVLVD
jgi:hypothetical protein